MGDFSQKSITKSATRTLASPIEDVVAFAAIVNGVVTNNPFGCTAYEVSGAPMPAVEETREAYTARPSPSVRSRQNARRWPRTTRT